MPKDADFKEITTIIQGHLKKAVEEIGYDSGLATVLFADDGVIIIRASFSRSEYLKNGTH